MEERSVHPLDYLSVVHRRKWWFIVPLVVCLLGGAALALFLPRTYYSQAEIGVAAATLSPELLKGVQSLDPAERQRAISQQLLSPAVLERVVREESIGPSQDPRLVAAWLRGQIEIGVPQPIGRPSDRAALDSFTLGYTDSTPERAQQIANRLAHVFVEENSKTRISRAENTSELLAQQLKMSEARLAQLENELSQKKEVHMGRLPDQIGSNIQLVNGLRSQLESLGMQIRGEQDRLSHVESQIAAMEQGQGVGAMTSAAAAAVDAARSRLTTLEQQLAAARARYTAKHPEILYLEDEITRAREELAEARKSGAGDQRALLEADPAFRQRIVERDQLRSRIRTLQMAQGRIEVRISQLDAAVAAAPRVEQDLTPLLRDVTFERQRLEDLRSKYENAVIAEDLQRKEGGEHFRVIYGANLPSVPVSPNVLRLMAMALGLGLALGAGLVIGREFMDRSVHDAAALQSEFEVPVLGEIPRITARPEASLS